MKILDSIILPGFGLNLPEENNFEIEAHTDPKGNNEIAVFIVPQNMIGCNFDFLIFPSWRRPFNGSSINFNKVEIRKKNSFKCLYQFFLFRNGMIKENIELNKLFLSPGEYELSISPDPGNEVILKFGILAYPIFFKERLN
jgi:hypothetical protein